VGSVSAAQNVVVSRHSLGRARVRSIVVFAMVGVLFGSWVPRIPSVKATLHLSAGALGIALLAPALGAVIAMVGTGALVAAHGSRWVVRVAFVVFTVPPGFIGLTRSLPELFGVLLIWGAGLGSLDVAINSQAVFVQRSYDRPVMSNFHGMYSVGGLVGGGLGSLAAAAGVPVDLQLAVVAGAVLVVGEWAAHGMLVHGETPPAGHRRFVRPDRQLVLLGALGFAALLCEGSASDWSAVYLRVSLDVPAGAAGLGYVSFSLAMIAGRLAGDRLTEVLGGQRLFRLSCLVGAVGFGAGLALDTPASLIVGFGLLGVGVACSVPLVFSTAGRHADPGPSVASVTTVGYLGLLAGPSIIGAAAASAGLGRALIIVPVVAALSAVLAGAGGLGSLPTTRSVLP
jgi:MFS family permease